MTAESNDLAWLVQRRADVQRQLLALYRVVQSDSISGWVLNLAHLLVGAEFSLWRAVFLADAYRPEPTKQQHARDFLRLLIKDNAINYPQDRDTRAWSGGYYINNAYMRLDIAYDLCEQHASDGVAFDPKRRERVSHWMQNQRTAEVVPNLQVAWDGAYEASHELTGVLARVHGEREQPGR